MIELQGSLDATHKSGELVGSIVRVEADGVIGDTEIVWRPGDDGYDIALAAAERNKAKFAHLFVEPETGGP